MIAEATGVHPDTVARGVRELDGSPEPAARVRAPGGGRKKLTESDPELMSELKALVDPATRGDPMSPLRWTSKSTRTLAAELAAQGHPVGERTVAKLLHAMPVTACRPTPRPSRAASTRTVTRSSATSTTVRRRAPRRRPAGDLRRHEEEGTGRRVQERRPGVAARRAQPGAGRRARLHRRGLGKAIPYGVYDSGRQHRLGQSVGIDHDTAAFAVATHSPLVGDDGPAPLPRRRPAADLADGGGCNGYRVRAWKVELASARRRTGLAITVCHLPPGTSKWNKIEHRLFCLITMNWRGRPLDHPPDHRRAHRRHHHDTGLTVQAA